MTDQEGISEITGGSSVTRREALKRLGAAGLAIGPGAAFLANAMPAAAAPLDTTTVSLWFYQPSYAAAFKEIIKRFEQQNPGIKIQLTAIPAGSYPARVQAAVSSNTLPDLFIALPVLISRLAKTGKIVDLTGKLNMAGVVPSARAVAYYGGRLLAAPWGQYVSMPLCNAKVFKQNGISVPTTQAEFIKTCETLQAKESGMSPLGADGRDGYQLTYFYQGIVASALGTSNAPLLIQKGKVKLTDAKLVQCVEFIQSLKPYLDPGFLALPFDGTRIELANEKIAIVAAGGTSDIAVVKQVNPNFELGAFPWPSRTAAGRTVIVIGNEYPFVLAASSKKQEAAIKYLQFLIGKEGQRILVDKIVEKPVREDVNLGNPKLLRNRMFRAGEIKVRSWDDSPPLSDVFNTSAAEMSGLFTGRHTPKEFAAICQSKVHHS